MRIKYLIIQFNSEIRAARGGRRWNRDNLVPFYSLVFKSRHQTKAAAIELQLLNAKSAHEISSNYSKANDLLFMVSK